jgi:hypothetical protein
MRLPTLVMESSKGWQTAFERNIASVNDPIWAYFQPWVVLEQ